MKKYFFIPLLFCVMYLGCDNTSKNWQWRGVNRDGKYAETGLLKQWPADGPQLLWKFERLGDGHTSVAISDNKIYATGLYGDNLMLFVFDMTG